MTKIRIIKECYIRGDGQTGRVYEYHIYTDEETEYWINYDYERRYYAASEEDKPFVKKRSLQEYFDDYNRDVRNEFERERYYRKTHISNIQIGKDGEEFDIYDEYADDSPSVQDMFL